MVIVSPLNVWTIILNIGLVLVDAKDVIIVGAGMSGISAGRHLLNQGGFNVTILEARPDRYGGRMWTNKQALPNATGSEVEMGAAWIHGMSDKNPIVQIQKKLKLKTFATDYDSEVVYSYESGEKYSEDKREAMWDAHAKVAVKIYVAAKTLQQDISYEEALQKAASSTLLSSDLFQFTMTSNTEAVEGATLANISAKRYNPNAAEGFNDEDSLVVNGYTQILDGLVNGFEASEKKLDIQLDREVTNIEIKSEEKKVSVRSRGGQQYEGDVVLVTVPLGVLKADVITFTPSLPADFQEAVREVGFGKVDKLILEFDEVFWPAGKQVIGIAGDDDVSKRGLLWVWFNLYPVVNRPVLIGFNDGNGAIIAMNLTKQELIDIALKKFRKVFGDSVVNSRRLVASERTQWASDPFARGAYSFAAVGNTIEMQKALATPIPPYIYFAGEHTIPEFIGSVHGAYISGERAAQKITQGTVNPTSTVTSNTVTVSTASALCKTYTWVALSLTVFILNREP